MPSFTCRIKLRKRNTIVKGFRMNFEWDPVKAEKNQSKHDVSFEDAAMVLTDTMNMTVFDSTH